MAYGRLKPGQYIATDSPVHRLDPRSKIITVIIFMIAVFSVSRYLPLTFLAIIYLLAVKKSQLPLKAVFTSIKPILILAIFTSLIHLFGTEGKEILQFCGIGITQEGLRLAVQMTSKLLLLVCYASLLVLTTTPEKLSDGIEKLLSPLSKMGFPAHDCAMMMTIALRFIPTLFEETGKIIDAQSSRGVDFSKGGPITKLKAYIPVLIPVFILVFRRADRLATAMEARGYKHGEGKTSMYPLQWQKKDTLSIIIATVALITATTLNGV